MSIKKVLFMLCGLGIVLSLSSFTTSLPVENVTVTHQQVAPQNYVGSQPVIEMHSISKDIEEDTVVIKYNDEFIFIEEIAQQYGLDKELVHAIIMVESNYDTTAVSSANCLGLMQISPKWHADRMERLGVTDLYDPYGNVLVGCDYIAELLEDYDLEFALMIYNQGLDSATRTYQSSGQSEYSKTVMNNYYELLGENNG